MNFESRTVLAVFLREKGSGGYLIEVVGVEQEGSTVIVHVQVTTPGPHCFVTLALTQPFDIVDVPKTQANVAFEVETFVRDCAPY